MGAMKKTESAKTQKGDQTKALILETALEIFREKGYEQTTMRAIADKAKLSLGNAYYYFHSKEHLIQAFYHRTHEEHLAASVPALEKEHTLKSTPADLNATEDRNDRAVSRVRGRAIQNCRKSRKPAQSVF